MQVYFLGDSYVPVTPNILMPEAMLDATKLESPKIVWFSAKYHPEYNDWL